MGPNGKRDALRRYPALLYLAGAGLLGLLLPSALRVPQSGPNTLAEYAPQSGEGEGTSDFSELGQASSGGVGFGKGAGPGKSVEDIDADEGKLVRKPGQKRCVGKPPRQTEDQLSPPCISSYDGDNGGATARGVSRDAVNVALWIDGPLQKRLENCSEAPKSEDPPSVTACRAFSRFFNERYQTWGRKVNLWAFYGPPDVAEADLDFMFEQVDPFAVVALANTFDRAVVAASADRGALAVSVRGYGRIRDHDKYAPKLISFRPDIEDQASIVATYLCAKLFGGKARYSGDVATQAKTRKFGLYSSGLHGDLITKNFRETCGGEILRISGQTRSEIARMQTEEVTTYIVNDNPPQTNIATGYATQSGWFPEWVIPGAELSAGLDENVNARLFNQIQWANAIGITYDYRRGPVNEQSWSSAYREGCADCPEVSDEHIPLMYDDLTLLFFGLQAAGPKLTLASIDKGLHSIPQESSTSPYRPAAYFSPGNYTFVKDAAQIWWDPNGLAPGDPQPGCYRLVEEGARRRAGEWTKGDANIRATGPCQGSKE